VDCWIGVERERARRVVRVAGRLGFAAVPDLLEACDAGSCSLELDLTQLVSADAAGIEALRRIRGTGATLVGTPGYVQVTLDAHPKP